MTNAGVIAKRAHSGSHVYKVSIAVLLFFITSATFRSRSYDDKTLDVQVVLKLLALLCMTLIPLLDLIKGRFPRSRPLILQWAIFLCFLSASSLYSYDPRVAFVAASGHVVAFFFLFWLTQRVGEVKAVATLVATGALMCIGSLFVFYFVPELGVMRGWTATGAGLIGRMSGLTPSANGIGSISALTILFSVLWYEKTERTRRPLYILSIASAAVCLFLSDNRMSLLAMLLCLLIWWLADRKFVARHSILAILGLAVLPVLIVAQDFILSSISRSGDINELTTLTGRSAIWAAAEEQIWKHPLFGQGFMSSLSVLPRDPRLFHAAAHTHNLYLELLFSGGVIALIMFLASMFHTIARAAVRKRLDLIAILVFFLVRGVTEPTPYFGAIGFNAFCLYLVVCFSAAALDSPVINRRRTLNRTSPRRVQNDPSITYRS